MAQAIKSKGVEVGRVFSCGEAACIVSQHSRHSRLANASVRPISRLASDCICIRLVLYRLGLPFGLASKERLWCLLSKGDTKRARKLDQKSSSPSLASPRLDWTGLDSTSIYEAGLQWAKLDREKSQSEIFSRLFAANAANLQNRDPK